MRRSIQIVSACAIILVTGPGTGVSDSLAAEGEKIPCNNFCRTWMGYEAGAQAAPPARPDDTVTVTPSKVQLDPELATDHSASKTADSADKLHHPKPKRKGERDTADVSNRRSAAQSKTSKLAKNLKSQDDVVPDGRSGSEGERNRPPDQAPENLKKLPLMRSETSAGPANLTARGIPLPPRLPRYARQDQSGVAQAGTIAADRSRTGVGDARQAKPSTKANVTAGANSGRNAAELDVSHPATGSTISVAAKPTEKTANIGSDGAADGAAAVARSPALGSMLAIDPRAAVLRGKPQLSPENTPDSTKASATPTRAANGPVIEGAPTVGVVAPTSDPSRSAVAAPKADTPSPALAPTGEATSKIQPNLVGHNSAVATGGTVPAGSSPPSGLAFVPGSGSDKDTTKAAPKVDAPPSPIIASEEVTANHPPQPADKGSTVAVVDPKVVVPPMPSGQVVGPSAETDKQAARVASPAATPQTAARFSGQAASVSSPNTVDQGSQAATDAAANPKATSATISIGAVRVGDDDGLLRPAPVSSGPPARPATAPKVAVPQQAPVDPTSTHVAALNEVQTMSAPRVSSSPAALPNANRQVVPDLDSTAKEPGAVASSSTKAPIGSGGAPLGSHGDAYRASPGETASMVMAPKPGAAPDNPGTLVTISVNDVSAQPEKTTIDYTIMNLAASPVDILFIRCNAVDPSGAIVGSVFDYVVNIAAGQEIKRSVHMPSDFASGQTFSCANDAATH